MRTLTRDDTEHGQEYVLLSESQAEIDELRATLALQQSSYERELLLELSAERERFATLCDRAAAAAWIAWDAVADPIDQGRALGAEELAAEIRGPNVRIEPATPAGGNDDH